MRISCTADGQREAEWADRSLIDHCDGRTPVPMAMLVSSLWIWLLLHVGLSLTSLTSQLVLVHGLVRLATVFVVAEVRGIHALVPRV